MRTAPSAWRRAAALLVPLLTSASPRAQELQVTGRTIDLGGAPVARARVRVARLDIPPVPAVGRRGGYAIAAERALGARRLPLAASGRDGEWRMLLPPQLAAVLGAGILPLELRIEADGCATWRRSIGTDLFAVDGLAAALEPVRDDAFVELDLRGPRGRPRGLVLIERPFRVSGRRTLWLRDWLDIPAAGPLRFEQPARVPGEVPAPVPTARPEAYRVSVWAEDCDLDTRFVGEGERAVVALDPAPWQARSVLGPRGRPPEPPFAATWRVEGRELTLPLDAARIPLLGALPPVRATTGSGPVLLDAWDPDLALLVARPEDLRDADPPHDEDPTTGPAAAAIGELSIVVEDPAGAPLQGALVLVEDRALKRVAGTAAGFGVTDQRGLARLTGLPVGPAFVLVCHPRHGEREGRLELRAEHDGPLPRVRLRGADPDAQDGEPPEPGRPGTLLVEPARRDAEWLELGVVQPSGDVAVRRVDGAPARIRVDGLVPGPTTLYLQHPDGSGTVWGERLATTDPTARVRATDVPERSALLLLRTQGGEVPTACTIALDDKGLGAALFRVEATDAPGAFVVRGRWTGAPWIRVLAGERSGRCALPADGGDAPVVVEL
ncbi:MAG: carboxypeptidase regulatory-like domain-containing protein [Planctomycetes bacterium]|nr:carboxypeptidase regulatory-like domain-containing protein [Planctomycetota bacterium]